MERCQDVAVWQIFVVSVRHWNGDVWRGSEHTFHVIEIAYKQLEEYRAAVYKHIDI